MKTHLFNVLLMLGVLGYAIFKSFTKYDDASLFMVIGINLAETLCVLIATINFMTLIKWSKFDAKYHMRITLILAFVGVVTFNNQLFNNPNTSYLMIPLLLVAILGFILIAKRKKEISKH